MKISFRKLTNNDYNLLFKWCQNSFIYEWFEQRMLSYDEIVEKYSKKLDTEEQELLIIQGDNKDIGFVQIYKYDDKIPNYKNVYEFDLFIGEEEYLSKGIGTIIVNEINDLIYSKYHADAIILRPFKRNIRAIKCYLKCGYQIIDEYSGQDTLNNPEIITVLLSKKH